jgi:hypothetical protein
MKSQITIMENKISLSQMADDVRNERSFTQKLEVDPRRLTRSLQGGLHGVRDHIARPDLGLSVQKQ